MSETDPGPLPNSKMELAVTMAPHICQVFRIGQETPAFIIYYPHNCYPVKSPVLAMILLSLLYLFVSKPGKSCTVIP